MSEEKMNKNSKAKITANNKYNDKAYDRINIVVRKGTKTKIAEHAVQMDGSLNAFINRAIEETMQRDLDGALHRDDM